MLAFLQADLVNRLHWLTQGQLLDAVAIDQVTPGPVFTTATFIGYLLGRVRGAIVATVGIFLPGFLFVATSRPFISRIRRSKTAGAFLDGVNVNVGAVALMIAVTWQLSPDRQYCRHQRGHTDLFPDQFCMVGARGGIPWAVRNAMVWSMRTLLSGTN